jgi:HEAT repeat protein
MSNKVDDLKQLMDEFGEQPGALPFSKLYAFSDLAGTKLTDFTATLDTLPAAQRLRLVEALVELAEADIQVNFDAVFRHCLGDPDERVRAQAVDGLWENEDRSLVGPFLTMLHSDPSAQVRAAAAAGLGRFVLAGELEKLEAPVEARILTELLTTIHMGEESVEVRRRAVESVGYACIPEALEALELAYYDEDERMRLSAVVGMGRSCDKRWKDIVVAELANPSPAMRYEAALASGGLALREAVPALSQLLDDSDLEIRDAAIWSLGQIGGPRAREALLAAYPDADEDTQALVDEALAEQAFSEGELDFLLNELDEEDEDLIDDELWAEDEEDDEVDQDHWEG